MSEGLVVAFIGVVGTLLGSIIAGIIARNNKPLNLNWALFSGALGGLLLGLFIGLLVSQSGTDGVAVQASNPSASVPSPQNSGTDPTVLSVPSAENTPTLESPEPTAEPTVSPTPSPEPTLTPTVMPTSTAEPTLIPTLVPGQFIDNFDVSLDPAWSTVDPGLFVANGEAKGEGFIYYDPGYNNYKIVVRTKGDWFQVLFRAKKSERDYGLPFRAYALRCQTECIWDKTKERESDDSVWGGSISQFVKLPYEDEEFHTVTITVEGKTFTSYFDGEPFTSVSDDEYVDGLVALSGGPFDSFSIEPLP